MEKYGVNELRRMFLEFFESCLLYTSTLLPEMLRGLNNYRMLIYAIVLIVMMLLTASPKAIQIRERWISSIRKPKTKEEA